MTQRTAMGKATGRLVNALLRCITSQGRPVTRDDLLDSEELAREHGVKKITETDRSNARKLFDRNVVPGGRLLHVVVPNPRYFSVLLSVKVALDLQIIRTHNWQYEDVAARLREAAVDSVEEFKGSVFIEALYEIPSEEQFDLWIVLRGTSERQLRRFADHVIRRNQAVHRVHIGMMAER